jgi:hypothetical protein
MLREYPHRIQEGRCLMSAQLVPFSARTAAQATSLQDLLATAATVPSRSLRTTRPQLAGGVYSPDVALDLMNSWFLVSERDGEVGIFRIEDDGALTYLAPEHFTRLHRQPAVRVKHRRVPRPARHEWLRRIVTASIS